MRPTGRAQAPPDGWLAVGHLRRPHGLKGDIFVQLTTDRRDRVEPGSEMFGRGVMLKVVSSRVAGKGRVVARFENIDDRTEAERWTNVELFAAPIDDPNALWVHDLIGQQVVDQRGIVRGECVMILANPAAEILELDSGSLVPSNFIVSVSDGVISVEVPEGLFELNDA
ncbi:MAG: 16S rRNA processing protein RimM [Candidatus Aldehydirespiratoraceae bacterium]|jgi:16S rRNA processing protein RimM